MGGSKLGLDIVPAIGIGKFKSSRYRIVNIGISAISSIALYIIRKLVEGRPSTVLV